MKIQRKHLFWLILLVGVVFRAYQLGAIPSILNRDEAALAYNAYLLMETGQDEWQQTWPLTLQSFGDYKLSGYPFLLIPFFKIFGLHDWVVRVPSLLAGIALIPLSYLLARAAKLKQQIALWVMALVALSPVFIFYSRTAYEANVALTYLVSSLLLLLSMRQKQTFWKLLALSVLLLVGIFTYNTPFLLLPFLVFFMVFLFPWKKWRQWLPIQIIFLIVFAIGISILLPLTTQKSGITIFTDETVWSNWVAFRSSLPGLLQKVFGNRYVYFLLLMIRNFFLSFSPRFLVTHGGAHEWHSLPTMGHVFWLVYGLGILGTLSWFFSLVKNWFKKSWKAFKTPQAWLLYGMIMSLAPSIVTVDAPHATRSLLFFVFFHVAAGFGIQFLLKQLTAKRTQQIFLFTITVILVGEAFVHGYRYFIHYPQHQHMFQPGFEQAIQEFHNTYGEKEGVVIIDPAGYHYILTAWYLRLTPTEYHSTINRQLPDKIGFRYGDRLLNFHYIARILDRQADETTALFWEKESQRWIIRDIGGEPG